MEENQEKCCKNCRFFLQHYVKGKTRSTYFSAIECGHCICGDVSNKERKSVPNVKGCIFWQPMEIQKEERMESILSVLRDMAVHIEQIAFILKEDIK